MKNEENKEHEINPNNEKSADNDKKNEELKQIFDLFDADRSGTISNKELRDVVLMLQPDSNDNEIAEMIKTIDVNGDGNISFDEFKELMNKNGISSPGDLTEEEVELVFGMLDKDKNDLISASELKALVKQVDKDVTDDEIELMIQVADEDNDNLLNMREFKKIMIRNENIN